MWDYEKKIAFWFIIIPGLVFVLYTIFKPIEEIKKDPFEVVSSYKGCDVVRYTDNSQAWHYFLKCAPETYDSQPETGGKQLEPM